MALLVIDQVLLVKLTEPFPEEVTWARPNLEEPIKDILPAVCEGVGGTILIVLRLLLNPRTSTGTLK